MRATECALGESPCCCLESLCSPAVHRSVRALREGRLQCKKRYRDQSMRPDQAVFPDFGPIEDCAANSDERTVADFASVEHNLQLQVDILIKTKTNKIIISKHLGLPCVQS